MSGIPIYEMKEVPKELMDCFEEVLIQCGAPWERVVEKGERIQAHWQGTEQVKAKAAKGKHGATSVIETGSYNSYHTVGWRPTCECDAGDPVPCVVADIFLGSGTTAMVAVQLGRDYLGIELNPAYAKMADDRIGSALAPETYTKADAPDDSPLFRQGSE